MRAGTFLRRLLLFIQHLQNTLTPECQVLKKCRLFSDFLNLVSWHSVYARSKVDMSKHSCRIPRQCIFFSPLCSSRKADGFQVHPLLPHGALASCPTSSGLCGSSRADGLLPLCYQLFPHVLPSFHWSRIRQVLYNFLRFLAYEYHPSLESWLLEAFKSMEWNNAQNALVYLQCCVNILII